MNKIINLILLLPCFLLSQEKVSITLKNGDSIKSEVLKETNKSIFLLFNEQSLKINKNLIRERTHDEGENNTNRLSPKKGTFYTLMDKRPLVTGKSFIQEISRSVVTIKNNGGLGSGVIISEQGHILTNFHVIKNNTSKLRVTLFEGKSENFKKTTLHNVKVLAFNPLRDIALIKISPKDPAKKFSYSPIAKSANLTMGDSVFTIGNPLRLEQSVTRGIVSSVNRTLDFQRFIQTDAAINPGNSGGALFDENGLIVGIATLTVDKANNLSFCIPREDIVYFLDFYSAYLLDDSQTINGIKYHVP